MALFEISNATLETSQIMTTKTSKHFATFVVNDQRSTKIYSKIFPSDSTTIKKYRFKSPSYQTIWQLAEIFFLSQNFENVTEYLTNWISQLFESELASLKTEVYESKPPSSHSDYWTLLTRFISLYLFLFFFILFYSLFFFFILLCFLYFSLLLL